jgi:3-hydroxyacyl-CoA dehydrogenase
MLNDTVDRAEKDFKGVLIFNQGEHFSVGANLFLVVMAAQQKKWDDLATMIKTLQDATQRMKYSSVPVVAAPYGMTVGGGLEVCLASNAVQAYAETYSGLVEVGVGLIPGGAGNLNLVWRALENVPDGAEVDTSALVTQVFKNIAMANVATSADAAKEFGYFRQTDGVSFDRARHLYEAKAQEARHRPVRRRVRREPQGHRGRDARTRARSLREPVRRAQVTRAHAAHAHEEQAAAQLTPTTGEEPWQT